MSRLTLKNIQKDYNISKLTISQQESKYFLAWISKMENRDLSLEVVRKMYNDKKFKNPNKCKTIIQLQNNIIVYRDTIWLQKV